MSEYSKYNLVYRLQKWIDTVPGQTFLNYAYSWGASIVILGALFKLTHIPGANVWLFIGMGTEVIVFFLSAFDRPFDKTADGREIPTRITEEYLATGKVTYGDGEEASPEGEAAPGSISFGENAGQAAAAQGHAQGVAGGGGTIVIGTVQGGGVQGTGNQPDGEPVSAGEVVQGGGAVVANYVPQMSAEEAEKLNEAQGSYVEELKKLVETLEKVNEQSSRLARDSEEMENLNRTLTGISRVYEMQLKGASQQIGTIDQINDQSRKLATQIEQLNKIYARMIEAMTVNMPMGAQGTAQNPASNS